MHLASGNYRAKHRNHLGTYQPLTHFLSPSYPQTCSHSHFGAGSSPCWFWRFCWHCSWSSRTWTTSFLYSHSCWLSCSWLCIVLCSPHSLPQSCLLLLCPQSHQNPFAHYQIGNLFLLIFPIFSVASFFRCPIVSAIIFPYTQQRQTQRKEHLQLHYQQQQRRTCHFLSKPSSKTSTSILVCSLYAG